MKKVGIITTNKMFAQSLAASIREMPDRGFEPHLLLNPKQAQLDVEVLGIDVAIIDVVEGSTTGSESTVSFCENLRKAVPDCRLLLLISQDDKEACRVAVNSTKKEVIDDFVFYDASLGYLLTKLASL